MPSAPGSALAYTPDAEEALLPVFPKVVYEKNPLEYVVCEFRFPPILTIDLEVPAKFQEAVREDYPLFNEGGSVNFAPPELAKFLSANNAALTGKRYEFSSSDNTWQLALTRESLALTCRQYTRWDQFLRRLELPFQAFLTNYNPRFFVRLGLRYRDVIYRERLGLQNIPWSELLAPGFVADFHTTFAPLVVGSWHQVVLRLQKEETQILLQHGLQPYESGTKGCYIIDADFFTLARTEPQNAFNVLRFFNKHSWSVFRACIADKLHEAMGPNPV